MNITSSSGIIELHITSVTRGIFSCQQLSGDYFICQAWPLLLLNPSHPLLPKWQTACQRHPPCPKLNHHSALPAPWDKSCHLFLHLWQTLIHLSIHPLFCAMCLSVICLVSPASYMFHPNCANALCHTGLYDSGGGIRWEYQVQYPQSFVFTCTLRQIRVRHKCIVHSHQYQGLDDLAIREMWQLD